MARGRSQDTQAVEAYLAAAPAGARAGLQKLRRAIKAAAPGAEECISYGIPAFRLEGRPFMWYAAWTKHSSLYPIPAALRPAFKAYEIAKGTIKFPPDQPPPAALVKRLVKARIAEVRSGDR